MIRRLYGIVRFPPPYDGPILSERIRESDGAVPRSLIMAYVVEDRAGYAVG